VADEELLRAEGEGEREQNPKFQVAPSRLAAGD
jgi:hypothetical protein